MSGIFGWNPNVSLFGWNVGAGDVIKNAAGMTANPIGTAVSLLPQAMNAGVQAAVPVMDGAMDLVSQGAYSKVKQGIGKAQAGQASLLQDPRVPKVAPDDATAQQMAAEGANNVTVGDNGPTYNASPNGPVVQPQAPQETEEERALKAQIAKNTNLRDGLIQGLQGEVNPFDPESDAYKANLRRNIDNVTQSYGGANSAMRASLFSRGMLGSGNEAAGYEGIERARANHMAGTLNSLSSDLYDKNVGWDQWRQGALQDLNNSDLAGGQIQGLMGDIEAKRQFNEQQARLMENQNYARERDSNAAMGGTLANIAGLGAAGLSAYAGMPMLAPVAAAATSSAVRGLTSMPSDDYANERAQASLTRTTMSQQFPVGNRGGIDNQMRYSNRVRGTLLPQQPTSVGYSPVVSHGSRAENFPTLMTGRRKKGWWE